MPPFLTWTLLGISAAIFLFGLWVDGRTTPVRLAKVARYGFFVQVLGLVSAYGVLRPGRGVDGREALQLAQQSSVPVLLDVYSNY